MKVFYMKILFFLSISYGLLSFCGCVIDPEPFYSPEKLKGQPNSFKIPHQLFFLYSKADEDKIQGISVEDRTEKAKVWDIKAISDIPVPDFKVTVGEVPEGFEQLIPKLPEKFVPIPGRKYTIYIHTKFADNHKYSPHIGPFSWVTEPLNESDSEK